MLLWNKVPLYNNKENDFMFIQFLLIDIFGGEKLGNGDISDGEKLLFIKELLAIRVKDDVVRLNCFDKYAIRIMEQFKMKTESDK